MKTLRTLAVFFAAILAQAAVCSNDSTCICTGCIGFTFPAPSTETLSFGTKLVYTLGQLEDGIYQLTLTFHEPTYASAGRRLMTVTVDDAAWLTGFDVTANGGYTAPIERSKLVVVTGGSLKLVLTANFGSNAILSQITLTRPVVEYAPAAE